MAAAGHPVLLPTLTRRVITAGKSGCGYDSPLRPGVEGYLIVGKKRFTSN